MRPWCTRAYRYARSPFRQTDKTDPTHWSGKPDRSVRSGWLSGKGTPSRMVTHPIAIVGISAALLLTGSVVAAAAPSQTTSPGVPPRSNTEKCPWLNQNLPISTRVSELLSSMTLSQKIDEMHAHVPTAGSQFAGFEGYLAAQPSLCIPPLVEQDDSAGVADGITGVTQLPAPVTLASSWSNSLAYQYGAVNGAEHYGKGAAMALGPGINIGRNPRWGRHFEIPSEAPHLSGLLGAADTEGIWSKGVVAEMNHYDASNQKTYRNTPTDDDIVSQRALRESSMPSVDIVVQEADPASIMCSCATVNGQNG